MVRKKRITIAVLLALVAVAGAGFGRLFRTSAPTQIETSIVIDAADLDFGEIWYRESFVHPINVRNVSDRQQVVKSITGSCECQSFEPSSFSLEPGETKTVQTRIQFQTSKASGLLPRTEEFSASIKAILIGEKRSREWTIHGRYRHRLRYPNRIDIGNVSEIDPQQSKQVYPLYPLVDLDNVTVRSSPDNTVANLDKQGNKYLLTVIPTSTERKKHAGQIEITANTGDG